jgi:response regulator RpfG family c-di-GMP phosphodiesterase
MNERRPAFLNAGWFSGEIQGENRVGVAFRLEPLNWTVAVTELEDTFFSDIRTIQGAHLWILAVSVALLTTFLSIFIGYVIRPLERLAGTIGMITETNDLTQRAQIEVDDEIGTLAYKFNAMVSTLQENYRQLELAGQAEKRARQTAVEREQETLSLLGSVSDFRDEETGDHLRRIGSLAGLFADLLGLDADRRDLLVNGAPLHDIGKIAIPDAVLLKKGRLTPEEFEVIKRHAALGHALLKDAKSGYLSEGATIALTHHEKWDGSGYPNGLAGEDIPLSGRIVSLIDVFDALTSERPYKEAWPAERAFEAIAEQRGKHFDPRLVDLFVDNFDAFRAAIGK